MAKFQIRRDDLVGVSLYEREHAYEALLDFLADRRKGELRDKLVHRDDGSVAAEVDGQLFSAHRIDDG